MSWPTSDGKPPRDVPICGFSGLDGPCLPPGTYLESLLWTLPVNPGLTAHRFSDRYDTVHHFVTDRLRCRADVLRGVSCLQVWRTQTRYNTAYGIENCDSGGISIRKTGVIENIYCSQVLLNSSNWHRELSHPLNLENLLLEIRLAVICIRKEFENIRIESDYNSSRHRSYYSHWCT